MVNVFDDSIASGPGNPQVAKVVVIKTIIDKVGRCNASQSDVTMMAILSQTRANSNNVLNFHNDAYNMEADIYDFHYFCLFLVYKIMAYAKTEHWERNYLISKEFVSYPIK